MRHDGQLRIRYFNPRSRVGNDYSLIQKGYDWILFQSTFPRGERRRVDIFRYMWRDFNPRSRVGNDGLSQLDHWQGNGFQSTFPRGERQAKAMVKEAQPDISIHVPAWGTTDLGHSKQTLTA